MRAIFVSALTGVLFSLISLSVQATDPSSAAQHWQGQGVVQEIAPPQIILQHQAIPELQWPAMTMPFVLAKNVDTASLKSGDRVTFTLERAGDGFQIISLTPLR
ncbi:copper-binding protein [Lelliottia sp. F153]|uniref:copper-binding protein n=1 Tax=unclassified Lelliottia TaxID=2642424 RepID=UPI000C7F15F3|nr:MULTISPECIES: copper-binding protein [unclassified Lelliottia]PLY46471.1 copper-binding protein [Lelliottia sp. F159]PLY50732.1 copper-binding protein [Lelliottia sp. F154]PLY56394.1 copper-binding protein [Lelliottia sp. F153]